VPHRIGNPSFSRTSGVIVIAQRFLPALVVLAMSASMSVTAEPAPSYVGNHEHSPDDRRAIEAVLSTYTQAVNTGDEAAFEALLLDKDIPFSSTDELVGPRADSIHVDTRHYRRFHDAIFGSGKHYTQQFYNVRIEQDGVLAQASLDFMTRESGSPKGGYGFKTLQLLKVQGRWKITSEFYTARALPHAR
jgi:ketosteroid isomerase-like protein